MSLQDAARTLEKGVIGRTAFQRFSKDVLAKLCATFDLTPQRNSLRGTALKADYEKALFDFRERCGRQIKPPVKRPAPAGLSPMPQDRMSDDIPDDAGRVEEGVNNSPMEIDQVLSIQVEGGGDHVQANTEAIPTITFRVYNKAKDWMHIAEKVCALEANGDLNLGSIGQALGTDRICR
ncbi:hypothetical protein BV22DRAFT_1052879, partial [Leucogyrophana mollusca]